MLEQDYKLSLLEEDELGEGEAEGGEVKTPLDPLAVEESEEEEKPAVEEGV